MGLFSGLKDVFGGIMKIFEPILQPVSEFLSSGIGKAIMIGLSIFTLGTAMIAGAQAFAANAGTGFINAFVEGGKQFMATLTTGEGFNAAGPGVGPTKEAAAQLAGANTQQALQTGGPANLVEGAGAGGGGALEGAKNLTNSALQTAGDTVSGAAAGAPKGILDKSAAVAAGPTKDLAKTGGELATRKPPIEEGGWLSKAAKTGKDFVGGLKDFAGTEGGGQVIGSLIQGAGNYYTEKDRQEFQDRIRREWGQGASNPNIREMRAETARVGELETPSAAGIATATRDVANAQQRRPTFERPYGAQPTPAGG